MSVLLLERGHEALGDNLVLPSSTGLKTLGELAIPDGAKDDFVLMGFARHTSAMEATLPKDGLIFVDMNAAAYAEVPAGTLAQVYTKALAGCTGIAGVAETPGGAVAGVSHFDSLVNRLQRRGRASASEQFMYRFTTEARQRGALAVELVVAYDKLSETSSDYGRRLGVYDDWYFLDQLETAAKYIGEDVAVTFMPYETGTCHALAANIDHAGQATIAFE